MRCLAPCLLGVVLVLTFTAASALAARLPGPATAGPSLASLRGEVPAVHPPAAPGAPVTHTTYLSVLMIPGCTNMVTGWRGEYWSNETLSGSPVVCRNDANLSFDWGWDSADPRLPADHFSARWTRTVNFAAGRYRFHLAGDDGVRLWIDGSRVIDGWQVQANQEYSAELDLKAGVHSLKVEYFDDQRLASVRLWWEQGPFSTCPAYQAEYYPGQKLEGQPVWTGCENSPINYSWKSDGPGHGLSGTNFSVRWTARLPLAAGTYVFQASTDDGMRVWIDDQLLIDKWQDQSDQFRATRTLAAGSHSIKIEYYQNAGAARAQFYWQRRDAGPGIVISQQQGIDACTVPSVDQMQAWWDSSPYWEINLYLGGSLRACNQPLLTTGWIAATQKQGWNFIPTWVGPQAPCTAYKYRMSGDAGTAYNQGRAEADAAAAAARGLGLDTLGGTGGSTIIYYDMEAYTGDAACRATVKSFMSGWTARLHELGIRSGGYGSPTYGYIGDWAAAANPPDDIWAATYYYSTYTTTVSVWNLPNLSNSLWPNHQRIWQYAGGHDETWGGVSLNVDSNVLDAHVAGENVRIIAGSAAAPEDRVASTILPADVRDMQALPDRQGWALAGERLWWTNDGGDLWSDITPALAPGQTIRTAHYRHAGQGWLLLTTPPGAGSEAGYAVARTLDGGKTWRTTALAVDAPLEPGSAPGAASFDFLDAGTGWLAMRLPSGSNFSRGALFATHDGGATWESLPLPVGGAVRFVDARRGWVAGGAGGDELYETRDGGYTWQPRNVPVGQASGSRTFYSLPLFESPQNGALAVTIAAAGQSRVEMFQTQDGGESWQASATVPLPGPVPPGAAVPARVRPQAGWVVGDPGAGQLRAAAQSGQVLAASHELVGLKDLQFADADHGWALVRSGECSGDKAETASGATQPLACVTRAALLATTDGGQTWVDVSP